jgi:ABC-type branched-subunit amino acid transport system substrate-binding protein
MTVSLRIGALIDFEWGLDIFSATIAMLNDPNDGIWDDLLDNNTFIEMIWRNDACNETTAVEMYWDEIRTNWYPALPHAVIGCHCSGASAGLARAAGFENVPVVSMSSTSYQLSYEYDFKNFFRTVAPDDARGQVGALVALFRSFDWDRVSIIGTDTQYSRDMTTKFGEAWVGFHSVTTDEEESEWTGSIAYSHTISLNSVDGVDDESVQRALEGVPTNNPLVNSRVVLLIATADHASRILELARQTNFQTDTIWIASDGWVGRGIIEDTPSLPLLPGSLGLTPFHSRESLLYQAFLERYNRYQADLRQDTVKELPIYAAETIDAILAVVRALVPLSPDERNNGTEVINNLYNINFTGVSGDVAFDKNGRFRKNPRYELNNVQQDDWKIIPGIVTPDMAEVQVADICWPSGCNLSSVPSDNYDVPPPIWMYIVFPFIASLIAGLSIKHLLVRKNMNEMRKKLDAIDNIDEQLANINDQVEDAKKRQNMLLLKREELQETPNTWSTSTDILIEVFPEDDQYWSVAKKLRQSMEDAWISKVWRVQNKPLWTYYSFHKKRLEMNGIDDKELAVWHGTSSLEPSIIYADTQDGFMMQFSRKGLWGRGLYFATKSSYSHSYSYKPDEKETPHNDEREMFLAKLLVGNVVEMNRDESPAKAAECSALTVPPINPVTGMKYNTVTGWTGGSHIWVVYENGRAYPDYLVRYYKGKRDPTRTPYKSKEDLARPAASPPKLPKKPRNVPIPDGKTFPTPGAKLFVWEYEDDGWHPIAPQSQVVVESAYLAYKSGSSPSSTKLFKGETWTYDVDFDTMRQTNVNHPSHRQRKVRRTEVDVDIEV